MPAPDMYSINTAGTFNVFEAADAEGVGRIVQASSINAIGLLPFYTNRAAVGERGRRVQDQRLSGCDTAADLELLAYFLARRR